MERRTRRLSDASHSSSDSWSIIDSRRSAESPADSEELLEDEVDLDSDVDEAVEAVESCEDDNGSDVEEIAEEEEEEVEEEEQLDDDDDEEPPREPYSVEMPSDVSDNEDEEEQEEEEEEVETEDDDVSVVDESESLADAAARHFVPAEKINRTLDELSRQAESPASQFIERVCEDEGRLKATVLACVFVAALLGASIGHIIGGSWMSSLRHAAHPELSFATGLQSRWVATPVPAASHAQPSHAAWQTQTTIEAADDYDVEEEVDEEINCDKRTVLDELEELRGLPPRAHPGLLDRVQPQHYGSLQALPKEPVTVRPLPRQYNVDEILAFLRKHDLVYDVPHRRDPSKWALAVVPQLTRCHRHDANLTQSARPVKRLASRLPTRRYRQRKSASIPSACVYTLETYGFTCGHRVVSDFFRAKPIKKLITRHPLKGSPKAAPSPSLHTPSFTSKPLNVTRVYRQTKHVHVKKHTKESFGAPICDKRKGPKRPSGVRRPPVRVPKSIFRPDMPRPDYARPCPRLPSLTPPPSQAKDGHVPSLLIPQRFEEIDAVFEGPCELMLPSPAPSSPRRVTVPTVPEMPPPSFEPKRDVCRRAVDHPNKTFSQTSLAPVKTRQLIKPPKMISAAKWARQQAQKTVEFKQCGHRNDSVDLLRTLRRREAIDRLRLQKEQYSITRMKEARTPPQCQTKKNKKKTRSESRREHKRIAHLKQQPPCRPNTKLDNKIAERRRREEARLREEKAAHFDLHRSRQREAVRKSDTESEWLFDRSRTRAHLRDRRPAPDWVFDRSRARANYRKQGQNDDWLFERSRARANYRRF